jgi:hypothetical protein
MAYAVLLGVGREERGTRGVGFVLVVGVGTPLGLEGKLPCTFAALLELPVVFVDFAPPPIAWLRAGQFALQGRYSPKPR